VLNWGLGHAARCVPIINELLHLNAKIIIASDGDALTFLSKQFPFLTFETLPAYDVTYPKDENMVAEMAFQLPKLISAIKQEQIAVNRIVQKHRIELIISDNRYGCHHSKVKSIFITHQLHLQMPFNKTLLRWATNSINRKLISRFNKCWIPDLPSQQNLSGALAHPPLPNCEYIGALSRFKTIEPKAFKYKVFALVSGPEPQRSIFSELLQSELKKLNEPCLLVLGSFLGSIKSSSKQINIVNFMNTEEIAQAMSESSYFVSRSGYSTIMDLAMMQPTAKVIWVPTPGQTEQEYLANKFEKENLCVAMEQKKLSLSDAIEKAEKIKSFKETNYILESSTLLSQALTSAITS
jgi:uncharacterized protein (TIGR00661 family)